MDELMEELQRVLESEGSHLANIEMDVFALLYRDRLPSKLGRRYMDVRAVHIPEIESVSLAYHTLLGAGEWDELVDIDVAAWAQRRTSGPLPASPGVLVVIQLSLTVNSEDVRRIQRRAEILRRIGLNVDAAVDGEWIRPDARELAEKLGVVALVVREPQAA